MAFMLQIKAVNLLFLRCSLKHYMTLSCLSVTLALYIWRYADLSGNKAYFII